MKRRAEMVLGFFRFLDRSMSRQALRFTIALSYLAAEGCASSMMVDGWQTLPGNTPIEIHLTDGSTRSCEIWRITEDSTIVGLAKTDSGEWRNISLPQKSIKGVVVRDAESQTWVGNATVVAGCAVGIAAVVGVIVVLTHIPSLATPGLFW